MCEVGVCRRLTRGYAIASCSLRSWLAPPRLCVNTHSSTTPLCLAPPQTPLDNTTMRLLATSIRRPRIAATAAVIARVSGRRHLTNNGFFRVSDEVREALNSNKPVVALETTIYTHGEGAC